MLQTRVIPVLLLKDEGLVKTEKFKNPKYIGDPINAVKIFNDKEVDELVFLDISATPNKRKPNFELIRDIAEEAFMPFGYGGGITELQEIEKLFNIGVEKIILNTIAYNKLDLIVQAAKIFGNQSIVGAIDVKRNFFNKQKVFTNCGTQEIKHSLKDYSKMLEDAGVGEIIINSIDKDGTMTGYDLELIKTVTESVTVPVVALGGAGNINDLEKAVVRSGASASAAGSMFVFNGPHRAVLITYPNYNELVELFDKGK